MRAARRKFHRAWGWILLTSLVIAAAVGVYSYFYEPDLYQSTLDLYVASEGAGLAQSSAGNRSLLKDCKQLLRNSEILEQVEMKLMPQTMDEIRLAVAGEADSHIIQLRATGPDPELCQTAVTALGVVFSEHLQNVAGFQRVAVANRAQFPLEPILWIRVEKILLAFGGSFLLLTLLFFLLVSKRPTIGGKDIFATDFGTPVLGGIPDYRKDMSRFFHHKGAFPRILYPWVNRSSTEAVKTLSLSLWDDQGHQPRSVVMASYGSEEEKSSLMVMLGNELCDQGKRVLLVDMDWRAPTLGDLLGTHGAWDLVHHLSGEATLDQVILPTQVDNLFLIDNLHPQSQATWLVGSKAFAAFMSYACEVFDHVLLDTPPLSLYADAMMLGSLADGTLLVAAEYRLTCLQLREMIHKQKVTHQKLLGIVFSLAPNRKSKPLSE